MSDELAVCQVFHLVHLECPAQVEDARDDPAAKKQRPSRERDAPRDVPRDAPRNARRRRSDSRSPNDGELIPKYPLTPSPQYPASATSSTNSQYLLH